MVKFYLFRFIYNNITKGHNNFQLGKSNFEKEINRRIQLGWAAFGKLCRILLFRIPQCLETKVFD